MPRKDLQIKYVVVAACVLLVGLLVTTWSRPFSAAWLTNLAAVSIVHEDMVQPRKIISGSKTDRSNDAMLSGPVTIGMTRLVGYSALQRGQSVEAVSILERVAQNDRIAAFWLGEAYERLGRHDEAIAAWRQAGAASYFLGLGHKPYESMDYDTACLNYLRAVEIAPDMALTHMYAGHCYVRRGEFTLAEQEYRRAIQLDPQYGYPYIHLATLLTDHLKRPDEAADALRRCLAATQAGEWYRMCQRASQ